MSERTHIPRRAKQCENTAGEGEENEKVEEGELENVDHHSTERHLSQFGFWKTGLRENLKRTQVGVYGENVDKLQRRKYVGSCEETLQI